MEAPRRSAPRRSSRARRPHQVRGYTYRRSGRTVRVPAHYSREYPGQARNRRGQFQEQMLLEAYRRGERSARGGSRRRSSSSRRRSSGRRSGGMSYEALTAMEERICRNIERNSRGQFTSGTTRRRRRSRVAGYTRSQGGRRVRVSPYLREEDGLLGSLALANPIQNPITGGEAATLVGVTALGFILTDFLSRYLQTEPAGYVASSGNVVVPNAASVLGMPSWWNIGAQALISIAGFVGGGMVSRGNAEQNIEGGSYGAAALYGVGLGAGVHLIGQVFSGLMARWAGSKKSAADTNQGGTLTPGTLTRLFSGEIAAQNAQYTAQTQAQANTPAGNAVPGFAGPPQQPGMLGQPVMYPMAIQSLAVQQVPAGYIYVPAGQNVSTDNGNGTKTCPDGSVIASSTPCSPPAYVVYSANGQTIIQSSSQPAPPGGVVTGFYYAPAQQVSSGAPLNNVPPPPVYVPPPAGTVPAPVTCMPNTMMNGGGSDGGCGCLGMTPDTMFPD